MKYKTGCWHDFINWLGCIWRERVDNTVKMNTLFVDFKGIKYQKYSDIKNTPKNKKVGILIDNELNVYSLTHMGKMWVMVSKWKCNNCGVTIKYLDGVIICESCGELVEFGA